MPRSVASTRACGLISCAANTPVTGVFAAQEIKPQARVLATDRGIRCVVVDYDKLRGIERDELTLF